MELSLIYKYQPKYLKNCISDNNILHLINTLINLDNLNILLVGDSGTGKTTIINAIINEYYDNKIDKNNILFINSLKEQGISYYRNEVKNFCQTTSVIRGKKKIIVLDDIDTINEQSQQVFRNCIDKYSHNVHFLCSCINIQKVLDSLQSRTNLIKLSPFTDDNLLSIINNISDSENIELTSETKKFILSISNNSIRILINYLEKFKLLNMSINIQLAKQICSNITYNEFIEYTNYCINNDLQQAIYVINILYDKGYSVMDILDNYFIFVKSTKLIDDNLKYRIIKLICKYITVFHNIHEDEIELSLFTNNIISIFS